MLDFYFFSYLFFLSVLIIVFQIMRQYKGSQIAVGFFVLLLFFGFSSFLMAKYFKSSIGGFYKIDAYFTDVDGILEGTPLKVSGIKIGEVSNLHIDKKTFKAVVSIKISSHVILPKDSSIEIVSSGLLGSKFLNLVPGIDDETLKDGDRITSTAAGLSFEKAISKFLVSK